MNLIPYSIASCSPRSLETCNFVYKVIILLLIISSILENLSSVVHVALVPEDHLLHISTGVLLDVPDPVLDVVETLLVGDVIHQHDAHGAPVVGRGDRPEPLLARRVPDLQLDLFTVKLYCANLEVDT